jgi:hypothetical protein
MGPVGPETCRQQRRAPSSRTASACRRFRSVEFAGATRPYITHPLPQSIRQRAVILAAAMRAKMGRTMMTRGSAPRPSSWLLWASGLMPFAAGCAAPPAMPEASVPAPPVPSGQVRIWLYRDWEPSESLNLANIDVNSSYFRSVANGGARPHYRCTRRSAGGVESWRSDKLACRVIGAQMGGCGRTNEHSNRIRVRARLVSHHRRLQAIED